MPRLLENYALTKRPKGRADAFSQAPRKKTNRLPLLVGLRLMGLHRSAGKVLVKLFQKLADSQGRALSRFPQKAESLYGKKAPALKKPEPDKRQF